MRILQITSDLDGGGVDRLLYDYCSRMVNDFQFDFVSTSSREGILEAPLRELGCNIYHIPQIREGLKAHQQALEKILLENQYDIIHDHSGYKAWVNLSVAKKCGVPVRIAHSHQAFMAETISQLLKRLVSTPITKHFATRLFACGKDAAKWMWGKRAYKSGKVHIMTNAIQAEKFSFSAEKREKIRRELGIADRFVIGNVARFSYQKNHEFLIKIFAEVRKVRDDAILMLVGRGELEDDVKKQVKDLALEDSVIFMGVRDDVPDLLNAMDVFVLPSRFEGLPVTLVEVQANGLPAVVSDAITREMAWSDKIIFESLENDCACWSDKIASLPRGESTNAIMSTKFDINAAASDLLGIYNLVHISKE